VQPKITIGNSTTAIGETRFIATLRSQKVTAGSGTGEDALE
jgi:hypothetical protein